MENKELTVQSGTFLPVIDELDRMAILSEKFAKGGLYGLTQPDQVFTVMMKAKELGISFSQGLSHIHIIKGKPTISSELMLNLVYQSELADIEFVEISNERCVINARRIGNEKYTKFEFSTEDAKRAKLLGKDNWVCYPKAMCKARTIAEMARTLFPDAIAGCSYTTEELEDEKVLSKEKVKVYDTKSAPHSKPDDVVIPAKSKKPAPAKISKIEKLRHDVNRHAQKLVKNGICDREAVKGLMALSYSGDKKEDISIADLNEQDCNTLEIYLSEQERSINEQEAMDAETENQIDAE